MVIYGLAVPRAEEFGVRDLSGLRSDWWYNWTARPGYLADPQFVPMIWGRDMTGIADLAQPGRYTLWPNEPEYPNQANLSPDEAARLYVDYIWPTLGATNNLIVGGVVFTHLNWIEDFLGLIDRRMWPVGFHVHCYSGKKWRNGDTEWLRAARRFVYQMLGKQGELWITEAGVLSSIASVSRGEVKNDWMIPFLVAVELVSPDRVAWFSTYHEVFSASNLIDEDGELTVLGKCWNNRTGDRNGA